jgi:hypothetical protein
MKALIVFAVLHSPATYETPAMRYLPELASSGIHNTTTIIVKPVNPDPNGVERRKEQRFKDRWMQEQKMRWEREEYQHWLDRVNPR